MGLSKIHCRFCTRFTRKKTLQLVYDRTFGFCRTIFSKVLQNSSEFRVLQKIFRTQNVLQNFVNVLQNGKIFTKNVENYWQSDTPKCQKAPKHQKFQSVKTLQSIKTLQRVKPNQSVKWLQSVKWIQSVKCLKVSNSSKSIKFLQNFKWLQTVVMLQSINTNH